MLATFKFENIITMVDATQKELDSDFMKRINDWIFSQETPSDVTVCVDDVSFLVHTFPLISKCGYIKKLLSDPENTELSVINIPDIPGGPEGFELAAKFCYETNIKLSIENIAMARCVAEYLEMTEEYATGNLVSVTEAYLNDTGLTNISRVASILQSSGNLLPVSERVGLVYRCVDIIASMVTDKSHDSIVDWWAQELIVLRVDIFKRVLLALVSKGFKQFALGPVLVLYAQTCVRGLEISGKPKKNLDPKQKHEKRVVLETIVGLLPRETNAMSISFLSMLLRAAKYLDTTVTCRLELEKRMGLQLEQAVLDDILIPSFCFDGDMFFDVDTVQQIMLNYFEHNSMGLDDINYVSPLQNDNEKVGKLMETFLARIACDRNVSVSKFISFAECIPAEVRVMEDGMYRAIDIYLKAHPAISDMDRKKVCSLMDCQKLSDEARAHAAQNERLPVQTMVQLLYYEQQQLREMDSSPVNLKSQNIVSDEISSLKKENEELKFEIIKMKARLKEIEMSAIATGTTTTAAKPPLPPKTSLIRSVTKRLGKMTPFLQADGLSASTTRGRNKPAKDRRHSVS